MFARHHDHTVIIGLRDGVLVDPASLVLFVRGQLAAVLFISIGFFLWNAHCVVGVVS